MLPQGKWIARRVREAIDYRRAFADLRSCRLIFAESDRLPALIVDAFGDETLQIMERSTDKETMNHYSELFDKLYRELELRVK